MVMNGLAQWFAVELGGGLVALNAKIGYVNKLINLVVLSYFSAEVFTIS